MQTNDTELPTAPRSLWIDGAEVTEGVYVALKDDDPADCGEVWAVDANARVLVSWPVPTGHGFRYSQEWHPLNELKVVG